MNERKLLLTYGIQLFSKESIPPAYVACAGSEQSMVATNWVWMRLSHWAARLNRLAESIPGLLNSLKISSLSRICKHLGSPLYKIYSASLCSLAGWYDNSICCAGPTDFIRWRNRFLGIDFSAPELFPNTGSVIKVWCTGPPGGGGGNRSWAP
jgi:hypothetical protein